MLVFLFGCADDIGVAPADLRLTFDAVAWTRCDAAGLDTVTLDDAFWDLSETELPGTTARVMVGFANTEIDDGERRVEKVSRAVWQVSAHR